MYRKYLDFSNLHVANVQPRGRKISKQIEDT